MRELKFRVWNIELKQFIVGKIDFKFTEPLGYQFKDIFIFQQFTNLCDQNGREIYEGDILHLEGLRYTKNGYYEVCWDYGSFGCITEDDGGLKEFINLGSLNYKYEPIISFAVVAGNIYENPDLLTKQ